MSEAIFGFLGVIVGSVLSIAGGWIAEKHKYDLHQKQLWQEKIYHTLRQILLLFDRMIAYSGTSDRAIYQGEKTNAEDPEEQWQEILKLRRELVPDVESLYDAKTIQEFEKVFDDIWNCAHTVSSNGVETDYCDIVDEVNDFAGRVRNQYLRKG